MTIVNLNQGAAHHTLESKEEQKYDDTLLHNKPKYPHPPSLHSRTSAYSAKSPVNIHACGRYWHLVTLPCKWQSTPIILSSVIPAVTIFVTDYSLGKADANLPPVEHITTLSGAGVGGSMLMMWALYCLLDESKCAMAVRSLAHVPFVLLTEIAFLLAGNADDGKQIWEMVVVTGVSMLVSAIFVAFSVHVDKKRQEKIKQIEDRQNDQGDRISNHSGKFQQTSEQIDELKEEQNIANQERRQMKNELQEMQAFRQSFSHMSPHQTRHQSLALKSTKSPDYGSHQLNDGAFLFNISNETEETKMPSGSAVITSNIGHNSYTDSLMAKGNVEHRPYHTSNKTEQAELNSVEISKFNQAKQKFIQKITTIIHYFFPPNECNDQTVQFDPKSHPLGADMSSQIEMQLVQTKGYSKAEARWGNRELVHKAQTDLNINGRMSTEKFIQFVNQTYDKIDLQKQKNEITLQQLKIEKSRWRWPDLLLEGNLDEFTETRVH
jgi:hypothetical protein